MGNEGIDGLMPQSTASSASPGAAAPAWKWNLAAWVRHGASFSLWGTLQRGRQNPRAERQVSCGPQCRTHLKTLPLLKTSAFGRCGAPIFQAGQSVQRMCSPPRASGSNTSCCTCSISLPCKFTVNLTRRAFTVHVGGGWAAHGQ